MFHHWGKLTGTCLFQLKAGRAGALPHPQPVRPSLTVPHPAIHPPQEKNNPGIVKTWPEGTLSLLQDCFALTMKCI